MITVVVVYHGGARLSAARGARSASGSALRVGSMQDAFAKLHVADKLRGEPTDSQPSKWIADDAQVHM